jgi:hypothetical protein
MRALDTRGAPLCLSSKLANCMPALITVAQHAACPAAFETRQQEGKLASDLGAATRTRRAWGEKTRLVCAETPGQSRSGRRLMPYPQLLWPWAIASEVGGPAVDRGAVSLTMSPVLSE